MLEVAVLSAPPFAAKPEVRMLINKMKNCAHTHASSKHTHTHSTHATHRRGGEAEGTMSSRYHIHIHT
jgi:hypothetical protein